MVAAHRNAFCLILPLNTLTLPVAAAHLARRAELALVYHPEPHWSRVAAEIAKRGTASLVAGDDDPYFRYKRKKFVRKFLLTTRFDSKVVLEVGPGPGGNLLEVIRGGAARVIGVDISRAMLAIAAETLKDYAGSVELLKTDGQKLPLPDAAADLTFTVTVLHHNTD